MSKLNWSTDHSQITDEIINRSSSTAAGLIHDIFYNKTGKLTQIWTGAGLSGTQLVEGTDYTIGGDVTSFPGNITDPTPDVPYTTIAIINAAYLSTDLYVSYYPIADYVESEDFSQLVDGIYLATNDISTANRTTDLTVYEPGGASAMQTGAIVTASWSGGDATYYHKFTVSSGWKIEALGGANLAPGNGTTSFAWCGYGSGSLRLKLDVPNDRWIVVGGIGNGGCFDRGDTVSGEWEQCSSRKLTLMQSVSGGNSGALSNTLLLPMKDNGYRCVASNSASSTAADITYKFTSRTTTTVTVAGTANGGYVDQNGDAIIVGEWPA